MKERMNSIVVFHLGWLGDSIMTIPSMARLRSDYEDARIVRVINSKMERFFAACPYVDEVIPFVREGNRAINGFGLLRKIRGFSPDLFVNLHTPDFQRPFPHYFRDNLFAYMTGASKRAAYACSIDSKFLSHSLSYKTFGNERMDQEMLKVIDPFIKQSGDAPVRFWLDETEREKGLVEVKKGLSAIGIEERVEYFCVSPFGKRSAKEWEFSKIADLCSTVSARTGVIPLFLGSPADMKKMDVLSNNMNGIYVNFVGKTDIKAAAAIIEKSKIMVTVDSGLMHLASILGVPVVAIFGPGNPGRWHPIPVGSVKIFSGEAECAPCFLDVCEDKTCFDKIDRGHVEETIIHIMGG